VIEMQEYYHSVTLDKDKCKGCTNCIKRCPTEAIRVRDGKARIIAERCIDCGECIRICPYHAKIAVTDALSSIENFKYRIALPAPSLYGQFKKIGDISKILNGLGMIGFDYVFEVARGADYVTAFVKKCLQDKDRKKPLISSACPAIVRLIQVRFPELIENIVPVESPMEIAAQLARKEFCKNNNAKPEDVGVFFITPCAAKMTSIRNPIGNNRSSVDGAIAMADIYGVLATEMKKSTDGSALQQATASGVGWANSGGESYSLGEDNYLAVDGIHNVIEVLEEIENEKFTDLDFFEGLACIGGCVGGPLVVEDRFVAQNRLRNLLKEVKGGPLSDGIVQEAKKELQWHLVKEIMPKPVMKLDESIAVAIRKMEEMEKIYQDLPGLDCGSCGSPGCRTLAEDIVRGRATEFDCIFKLKEKVRTLAQEMMELSEKMTVGREKGVDNDED
jgi:iron only hydrogenase large subunit-like protein